MVETASPTTAPIGAPDQPGGPYAPPPARRWRWRLALLVVALIAAPLALFWRPVHGTAITAAAYGASVACSCRFVGGRPIGDCTRDFEPGMGLVTLSEDAAAKSVTARVPLLARQTAAYREGWGCVLEPWK